MKREQPIERLADALQACFKAAVQEGLKEVTPRLDKQDETLRMVWKQVGGNGKLPIDD